MPTVLGAWGVLPVAVPLFALVAARFGDLAWAGVSSRFSDRAVAGVILAFASAIAGARILACFGAARPPFLVALLAVTALALASTRHRWRFGMPTVPTDAVCAPVLLVAGAALGLATLAARWLPIWQWDSLGYHLPFVHFTLAHGGVDGVPPELEYIGTYPHDVELFFVGLRACLPDDRLLDLGQIPFGLGGAVVVAAFARRGNATVATALAAGASWLVVPAVFLQLPTDYVDVATATFLLAAIYFVLASPTSRSVALAGLALGLFVGSKPSAPLPAAALFALLTLRGLRSGQARALVVAGALVVAFGAESYLVNAALHHNPIWPVQVDVGPIHLPGLHPLRELLAAGAAAPRLRGWLPWRVVRSLFALTSPPVFDMRVGGFGPVFLLALPFAVATIVRTRGGLLALAVGITLLSPDPAVARYILAFPGLVLATAAPWLNHVTSRVRIVLGAGFGVLAGLQLVYAAPGLAGEGPPLWSYARMTDDDRALAVGADGPPTAVDSARRRVRPGESFAFDENMDLCDLAWDARQSYAVVFLPSALVGEALGRLLEQDAVRVLAVGDVSPAGAWIATHPHDFERLAALPACRKGSCSLFARR